MKMFFVWLTAVVIGWSAPACAQVRTVDRAVNGLPDTDIRVAVYANVRPDCTSGPLPSVQLSSPPQHGKVTVKKAKLTLTNYKQCLALEAPGFAVFYHSRSDFSGVDVLIVEVKYPEGRTEVQRISVTVGTGPAGKGA
jgi:hypothetical protein